MSQANNKKENLIAIMAIIATLIVGIPGFMIFFDDKKEQKPNIVSTNPETIETKVQKEQNTTNNKDSDSRVTTLEENRVKPQELNEDQVHTVTNDQPAKNISFDLNGRWNLAIKADWFISSKNSQKIGRPNIGGHLKLSQTGNLVKGSFTARNWTQFKNAVVYGTIKNDSLFANMKCTEGYCSNNAGLKIIAKIYDNNKIVGNCLPIGEPTDKCALYIGNISIEKAL